MPVYDDSSFCADRSIGYLIRRAHQMGAAGLEPVFAAEGLTGIQWSALISVMAGRVGTAADLARDLGYDKGAMTRLVDQLEAQGWMTRERTAEDRRCIALSVTETGAEVALRCKARVVQCYNAWLADWPDHDVETLIVLLQKLRATLTEVEQPCG